MYALLFIGMLTVKVQGGKSGAGYEAVIVHEDGRVEMERTARYDAKVERKEGRIDAVAAKKLLERAKLLDGLRDSYDNDRQQSHWNTFIVSLGAKRVVVEGGSTQDDPALAAFFALVKETAATVKRALPDAPLRWL